MSAVKGLLTIASGANESDLFDKRDNAGGIAIRIPAGIEGIISVRVADEPDGSLEAVYNTDGALIQIDPSALSLPAWHVLDADLFPGHYIGVATFTDSTEATPQNQSAERQLRIMGISQ